MSSLLVVIIIVAAAAAAYGVLAIFRPRPQRVRRGATWIDHIDDLPPEEQPDEDARDEPVPQHDEPLRGRTSD